MYKQLPERDDLDLAGHVPVELSRALAGFLAASKRIPSAVQVYVKRKLTKLGQVGRKLLTY